MNGLKFDGDRLRQLRKNKGLTLENIANQTNVARQNISKWEKGKQKPQKKKLQQVLALLQSDTETKTGLNLDEWYITTSATTQKKHQNVTDIKSDELPNSLSEYKFNNHLISILQTLRFQDEKTQQKAAALISILLED